MFAAFGGELTVKINEGLREEALLAIAPDDALIGCHAADGVLNGLRFNAFRDSFFFKIFDPARERYVRAAVAIFGWWRRLDLGVSEI